MAIPYQTTKFKSTNILAIVILIPTNSSGYTVKFHVLCYSNYRQFPQGRACHVINQWLSANYSQFPHSGSSSSEADHSCRSGWDMGGATELPPRCLMDASHGEDLRRVLPWNSSPRLQAVADLIPLRQGERSTVITVVGLRLFAGTNLQILADFGNSAFSGYSF